MTVLPLGRIATRGGGISPAELLRALATSEEAGNDFIAFGSRQDIVFPVGALPPPRPSGGGGGPNIVTSSIAVGLTETTWWLGEGEYERVLDGLPPAPRRALNLVDPAQRLVPHFTGEVNFLASAEEHRWHLRIWVPGGRPESGARLFGVSEAIHSDEIPSTLRRFEDGWIPEGLLPLGREAAPTVSAGRTATCISLIEGLEPMPGGDFRLSVLRRDHRFPTAFLRDVARLCQETRIGRIGITPWKTLLVKGIRASERDRWEALVIRHRINLRHGALELPWHLPVLDEEALALREHIIRALDREDLPPGGTTFGIRRHPEGRPFTTLLIEEESRGDTPESPTYRVLRTAHAEPSAGGHEPVARHVSRPDLPRVIAGCLTSGDRGEGSSRTPNRSGGVGGRSDGGEGCGGTVSTFVPAGSADDAAAAAPPLSTRRGDRFRCGDCLTEYDPAEGDPEAGIDPGTPCDALPDSFTCYLCSAGPARFVPVAAHGDTTCGSS